ncbi:glycoside hydrolase [uncultured Mucilaginibacter sp.]|uniref:glycoside hydrolase n=1 Tax=uncultured Mucilaginibacter sp. TaxID=797541 RepID=UPI0025FA8030|nr:glycoside hydrolase [uncultured Mucilaginibacter sp.]
MTLNKASAQTVIFKIDARATAQTIHNIGASGCWYSEPIGMHWPNAKKEEIAKLLFSKAINKNGSPEGIGLSAWRFNIGGGSAEQGEKSGIKDPLRRVESFLNSDGTYNWNKQAGYQWFLQKAKKYGVEDLIAFSNTPPVWFTKNGLGYKTDKDFISNLKADKYTAFASFLADVLVHFKNEGINFKYISPINEPQWDWSNKFGEGSQEGSPWTNKEIHNEIVALDSVLKVKKLPVSIMTTEAAMLTYLYQTGKGSYRQIQELFGAGSPQNVKGLTNVPNFVAGHSYFTEKSDSMMVAVRKQLADTTAKYGIEYWQSEYSMLDNGFRESASGKRSSMDCALFLAKVINRDLTIANAAAWHFWNAYEPGPTNMDTRYYLIALHPDKGFKNGNFTPVKNLWALGNYSRFVRPGMQRLKVSRNDDMDDIKAGQDVMISAFKDDKGQLVTVLINYTQQPRKIKLDIQHFNKHRQLSSYVTSAEPGDNLKAGKLPANANAIGLKPRSITTLVYKN